MCWFFIYTGMGIWMWFINTAQSSAKTCSQRPKEKKDQAMLMHVESGTCLCFFSHQSHHWLWWIELFRLFCRHLSWTKLYCWTPAVQFGPPERHRIWIHLSICVYLHTSRPYSSGHFVNAPVFSICFIQETQNYMLECKHLQSRESWTRSSSILISAAETIGFSVQIQI